MSEAEELRDQIINLIEQEGCEVIRKDVRVKESGASWTMDLRLVVKPTHSEEVG